MSVQKLALTCLAIIALLAGCCVGMAMSRGAPGAGTQAGAQATTSAAEAAVRRNLRSLMLATIEYSMTFDNKLLPADTRLLLPFLERDTRISDPRLHAAGSNSATRAGDPFADFYYAGKGMNSLYSNLPDSDLIIFYDKVSPGSRRWIAFMDGHAAAFEQGAKELLELVARNNELRKTLALRAEGVELLPDKLDGPPK